MEKVDLAMTVKVAIEEGDIEKIKKLLSDKPNNINELASMGWWLHTAASYQQLEIAEFLIDLGVDVNFVIRRKGNNALVDAAGTGNMEMVELLIQKGIEICCTLDESNPIIVAVQSDNLEVVKYLLEKEKEILPPQKYKELIEAMIDQADIFASKDVLAYLGVNRIDKTKNPNKTEKNKIVKMLKHGIQESFQEIQEICKGKNLYIISLAIEDNLSSCIVYMNTEENYQCQLEDADDEDKEDIYYYRFCEDEWDVLEHSPDYFKDIYAYVEKQKLYNDDIMVWYELVVEAVCLLREEGYFEKAYPKDILISIYAHNCCETKEMIKIFEKMNKGKKIKDYVENIDDFF